MRNKKDKITCDECEQDLTGQAQYYDKGKVYCCECNYRKDGKEWPKQK